MKTRLIIAIAFILGFVVILLGGIMILLQILVPLHKNTIWLANLYTLPFAFSYFFSNKTVLILYMFFAGTSIGYALFSSLKSFINKRYKYFSLTFFALAGISCIYYFSIYLNYSIPVTFKPEVKYVVITQPIGIDAIHKNMQVSSESRGDIYEILGWQDNDILTYTKNNGHNVLTYLYNVKSKQSTLKNVDTSLYKSICEYKECLSGYEKSGFYQKSPNGYLSPGGKYIAVIYKHIYGPEDIVIIVR